MLATVVVFSLVAILAAGIGKFLRKSDKVQLYFNKFAAVVFLSLAIKLALVEAN